MGLAVANRGRRAEASGSLAAVFGEVAEQVVHRGERRAINQVAPLAFLADEPGVDKLFQMKRQRIGRNIKLFGECSGRESVGSRNDQSAEHPEAHFLGEGRKGFDNIDFFHETTIQR